MIGYDVIIIVKGLPNHLYIKGCSLTATLHKVVTHLTRSQEKMFQKVTFICGAAVLLNFVLVFAIPTVKVKIPPPTPSPSPVTDPPDDVIAPEDFYAKEKLGYHTGPW